MENSEKTEDFLGLTFKQRTQIRTVLIWMDCVMMLGISMMIILD